MPVSKKRKRKGKVVTQKPYDPKQVNAYTKAMGASAQPEFQKEMRKTNFETRERELRRERLKAMSEGKGDPFAEEQEFYGSAYKVGDQVRHFMKDEVRRIVEVQSQHGEIRYAWVSTQEAGVCTEKTMLKYANG